MNIQDLVRENIKNLKPYSSARDEFKGEASMYLDANENSYGSPTAQNYNRYPDPLQQTLKAAISRIKGVPPAHMFLGNGSDEAIDLLFRAFCNPGKDNVILLPPTYGMYQVSAAINDVEVKTVPLTEDFQLNLEHIAEAIDKNTKMIFICSPNNPTGNSIRRSDIEVILANFEGLVVIDEAYINYAKQRSFIQELTEYSNLVVLQTFSKAWGLAALRLGMAFSSAPVIEILNRIKPPYNINQATVDLALEALKNIEQVNGWIKESVQQRNYLIEALTQLPQVLKIYPSEANFLLVQVKDANKTYNDLVKQGIIVRNRAQVQQCEGCLRITVGTPQENTTLINTLKELI